MIWEYTSRTVLRLILSVTTGMLVITGTPRCDASDVYV